MRKKFEIRGVAIKLTNAVGMVLQFISRDAVGISNPGGLAVMWWA